MRVYYTRCTTGRYIRFFVEPNLLFLFLSGLVFLQSIKLEEVCDLEHGVMFFSLCAAVSLPDELLEVVEVLLGVDRD